jgi:hypothetical protein
MRVGDVNDMPLPPGRDHVGEILIRGHNVMKGYLGQPEVIATTLRGGWLHTGELGYVDEDGFYFIVDRIKDLVIRGGYNVYPGRSRRSSTIILAFSRPSSSARRTSGWARRSWLWSSVATARRVGALRGASLEFGHSP